jgi:hypothetical protein
MMISSISPSMVYQANPLVSNLRANGLTAEKAIMAAADVKGAIQEIGMVQRGPANKAAITAALRERVSADVAAGKLSAEDAAAVFKTFEQMDPAKQKGGAGEKKSASEAGGPPSLTKEQIEAQIAQMGASDSHHLAMLTKISQNFGDADADSDGKVSRDEADAYLQKTGEGSGRPPRGDNPDGPPPAEGAGGPPPREGAGGPPPKGAGGPPGGGGGQSSSEKVVLSETSTVVGNLQTTTTLYTDGTSETTTEPVSADTLSSTYSKASVIDPLKASATANNGDVKIQNYLSSITPGSLFDFLVQ